MDKVFKMRSRTTGWYSCNKVCESLLLTCKVMPTYKIRERPSWVRVTVKGSKSTNIGFRSDRGVGRATAAGTGLVLDSASTSLVWLVPRLKLVGEKSGQTKYKVAKTLRIPTTNISKTTLKIRCPIPGRRRLGVGVLGWGPRERALVDVVMCFQKLQNNYKIKIG